MLRVLRHFLPVLLILAGVILLSVVYNKHAAENKVLKQIVARLQAESRIAQALVVSVEYDERENKTFTTIKFLEYDACGKPMAPRYFTFSGNIIQFQTLVVRFDDIYIRDADRFKGKSVYLFLKAFMLDGKNTKEYDITKVYEVPEGYKISPAKNAFEEKIWKHFWSYALDPDHAIKVGIKNAQIEAPGTMFVPGMLYTLKIEHDGGIRIDASRLPEILKGERIPT